MKLIRISNFIQISRYQGGINVELHDQVVNHKVFGRGKIVGVMCDYVIVLFDGRDVVKKFKYPSSLGTVLKFENESLNETVFENEANHKTIERLDKLLRDYKASKKTSIKVTKSEKNNKRKRPKRKRSKPKDAMYYRLPGSFESGR